MATYQFAYFSRDLYTQIHIIESLVKSNVFSEARTRLQAARQSCEHLQSLAEPENNLQKRILTNRRLEIQWLETAIKEAGKKVHRVIRKKRGVK